MALRRRGRAGSRLRRGECGRRGVILGLRPVDGGLADVLLLQELAVAVEGALAFTRSAVARAICASLDATTWVAWRSSIRASTCPFATRSPTSARSSTIRPAICAATVDWRTASTTPSAA
jgi:hypothetical protein